MGSTSAVRARGISKFFHDVVALDEIEMDVAPGEVHGLLGPNGAGKTTLLGLLLGLCAADRGRLEVLGTEVQRGSGVPEGVAGFVDGPGLYPRLTARQNLAAVASLRRLPGDPVGEALEEVGLTDVADDRVRGFSLGMRQRLGLAAALVLQPRVLVLDEPANGLDPAGARQVHQVLAGRAARGTAVVVSSHRMDELAALCSEVTLLAGGRVVFAGPVAKLEAEAGELDHRLRTADGVTATEVARRTHGVQLLEDGDAGAGQPDVLRVRASPTALDALVAGLVAAGVGVRELTPVVPPLESAYLALTGAAEVRS